LPIPASRLIDYSEQTIATCLGDHARNVIRQSESIDILKIGPTLILQSIMESLQPGVQ
jgi:hypothetical protein